MLEKIKCLKQGAKKKFMNSMLMLSCFALAAPIFATSGDADLDTIIAFMTDGVDVMKAGGLMILGTVIGMAIVFIAGRWLFDLFKMWSGKAK